MTFETAETLNGGSLDMFSGSRDTSYPQPLPGASSRPFSENYS